MTEKRCTIHNGQIILDGFPLSNEKAAALINELLEEIRIFKIKDARKLFSRRELERENKELKQVIKEVLKLLEEVDLFSDKATEHDVNAYIELREFDNKDAYYMTISTKKAIKLLKEMIE